MTVTGSYSHGMKTRHTHGATLCTHSPTLPPLNHLTSTQELLKQAADIASSNPKRAEELYKQSLRDQESALIKLAELKIKTLTPDRDGSGLAQVIKLSRSSMSSTAKLICTLLNYFNSIPNSRQTQIDVLTDNIEWSKREKCIFLKHSLQIRLVSLQLEALQYKLVLTRIHALLTELKRLDDKMILTEVHLLESRVYRGIGNLSKSKVKYNGRPHVRRTAANSIYCPPHLQAALDLQSGVLHAEDKDYTTAYSYFYETFENMSSQDDPAALNALKYMLLCKVMPEDVTSLLSIKLAVKYAQLREIEKLSSDPTIRSHLAALYDTLLQQNLLRVVEPYSVVEIDHVAKQDEQGRRTLKPSALSQMILDKVFHGVLDQGRGCLIVFDELEADNTYGAAIGTLEQVSKVVDSLYAKTVKIA
ncbi:proteasome regulatory particle subunit [Suillus spraguei]|nr:proteasome regulatory particle subunit [Suillus spraguei]